MLSLLLVALLEVGCEAARAIWAVNAGGGAHRGVDGVVYGADPVHMPGVASDHGIHHLPLLARVHPQALKSASFTVICIQSLLCDFIYPPQS